mmetsp:Transcript_24881/g.37187  ORF Transcript_24881/g.37187 Transcript_24881/m.37187 type:complete len:117 (+) Transcript_24881:614-964(+)
MKFEFDEGGSGNNNSGNDNGNDHHNDNHNDNGGQSQTDLSKFKCPHCDKSFRDERARKNHIKCVHQNCKNNNNSNQKSSQQQQQQQQLILTHAILELSLFVPFKLEESLASSFVSF